MRARYVKLPDLPPNLMPAEEDPINLAHFVGRVFVFLVLLGWGWSFMVAPLELNYAGESVLHLVNLPFHEAGHVLFMPFGRFMMVLGGTLGQLLMPLICAGTFLLKTRDAFAASVALWWTAENFLDIAPYINDARALELILLGGVTGQEVEGHDWEYLLGTLGWLRHDHLLAQFTQWLGSYSWQRRCCGARSCSFGNIKPSGDSSMMNPNHRPAS